jgi:Transposase DDE domain
MTSCTKVARSAFYRWFDEPLERFMAALSERALTYARAQQVDLSGLLGEVKDWYIVDSTTVKVHKVLSVGCGAPVHCHFSPARERDSRHLTIDESWRGGGLLADLAYARLARLHACHEHGVRFVIRLKDNWKLKVNYIARGQVTQAFCPDTDLDALLDRDILALDGRVIDADVHVGGDKHPLHLRLVGVDTPKGYGFFLSNLPPRIGPRQVADIYRVRWEVEISQLHYGSRESLSLTAA